MNQKPSLTVPKIDLIKIVNKEYFYEIKRKFISNEHRFENQQGYEHFMTTPQSNLNLKPDNITIHKYEDEVSEEAEGVDKNGVFGISGGDVLSREYIADIDYNFFSDYLIPGIEKGKKSYLLDLKKSLINADKFKDHILLEFFSKKKLELRATLHEASKNATFKRKAFNIELEKKLYETLSEIYSYEQIYFPIYKIHLNLDKVQVGHANFTCIKS